MAASRPVVLVYQEFATLSSSPATPELNVLAAGPAYWIQDFPEDRVAIKLPVNYGFAVGTAATGAAVATTAVTRTDAPSNIVGAVLDQASVRIFTSATSVEMCVETDMTTTGGSTTVGSASVNFVTAGVAALDTIVMTDGAGPTTVTYTVLTVAANSLVLNREPPTGFSATAVKFQVLRSLPETEIDASHYTFVPGTNTIILNALATLPIGVVLHRIAYCELYVAYRALRTDLQDVGTLGSTTEIVSRLGRIDARNPLAAGVFVTLQNTNTTVQYFGIGTNDLAGFTAMRNNIAARKDIYAVVPLCSGTLATSVLAGLKAEFVSLADPDYALTNGTPQKFRVAIGSSAELPTTKIIVDTNTDGKTEVYAAMVAPTTVHTLTMPGVDLVYSNVLPGDTLTVSLDASTVAATGTWSLAAGNVAAGDTVTIGTRIYTFQDPLVNSTADKVLVGATPAASVINLVAAIMRGSGLGTLYSSPTTPNTLVTAVDGTSDVVDVTAIAVGALGNGIATTTVSSKAVWGGLVTAGGITCRNGTYTVAQVLTAASLEVDAELPGGAQSRNASIAIATGVTPKIATTAIVPLASVADAKLYLDLYDVNASFSAVGVMAGDLLEMPQNPSQSSFTTKHTFTIATVTDQRLRIVDNGRNNSLVASELPHGVSRNAPATLVPTTATLHYRITRTLDITGQVTELIAVTQSLASRRVVNVWPDLCDVTGLVDGSLARDPAAPLVAQPAATQPGYYLACAVGGMTAGLPSHQGFTNMGIAGISKIYNSNTYFSDKNITDISNGGWFVFQQDTPQALPYVVHQLTTDVSTLQSGEFSMVKNFDFVSIFFSDIVAEYTGIWNINPETLGFISASITGGIDNLKLRRRPRIGAPIIDGTITSMYVSPSTADRLESYIEIEFPSPLNTVALHLVSV